VLGVVIGVCVISSCGSAYSYSHEERVRLQVLSHDPLGAALTDVFGRPVESGQRGCVYRNLDQRAAAIYLNFAARPMSPALVEGVRRAAEHAGWHIASSAVDTDREIQLWKSFGTWDSGTYIIFDTNVLMVVIEATDDSSCI